MNYMQTRGYKCIKSVSVDGGNQVFEEGTTYVGIPLILLEIEGIYSNGTLKDYFTMVDLEEPIDMRKQAGDFWNYFFKQIEACK